MPRIPGIRRHVSSVVRRATANEEIDAELDFHLATRTEELVRGGLAEDAARATALREFGDVAHVRNDCLTIDHQREGEMRRAEILRSMLTDLRHAARGLARTPVFTAVAVATLALGIGATTAIFSVVSAVLLRPLPFDSPDRIVFMGESSVSRPDGTPTTAYDNVMEWQERSHSFEAMAVINEWEPALTGTGEPERIRAAVVTSGVFDVLRIRPALGRPILPSDNLEASEPVVLVGHAFWRDRLGGDPSAMGRTITLNGRPQTIIGVLPEGLRAPAELDAVVWGNNGPDPRDGHTSRYQRGIARLREGVTLEAARRDMRAVSLSLVRDFPRDFEGLQAVLTPLRDELSGDTRTPLLLLLGAAGLVLLIACANLSNLFIARGIARSRELAVRIALGAGRRRIVRHLMTESLLLASVGGALGVSLGVWSTRALVALGPQALRDNPVGIDARVMLFAMVVTVATAVAFGLLPALRAARVDPQEALREGARGTSGSGARSRRALVVGQLAVALSLLIGAGVLLKSFSRLQQVDPGIRPEGLLSVAMNLPGRKYPLEARAPFFERLQKEAAVLPGVQSAAVTSMLPFEDNFDRIGVSMDGEPARSPADQLEPDRFIVSPRYFQTMGIRRIAGRLLEETDRYDSPLVLVVDEQFARRISPDGNVIGRRIRLSEERPIATIVGIVGHVKHYGLDVSSQGQLYISHVQYPWQFMRLVVRTSRSPEALVGEVRKLVRALDPEQPVYGFTTVEHEMSARGSHRRFVLSLLGAFAGLALVLATIGLYGVIAYAVTQRERELGIRVALGARPGDLLRLVVGQGVRLAVAGVAVGLIMAAATTRLLSSMLFGVSATDTEVWGVVAAMMLGVAVLASWLPARRAARASPMLTMRGE